MRYPFLAINSDLRKRGYQTHLVNNHALMVTHRCNFGIRSIIKDTILLQVLVKYLPEGMVYHYGLKYGPNMQNKLNEYGNAGDEAWHAINYMFGYQPLDKYQVRQAGVSDAIELYFMKFDLATRLTDFFYSRRHPFGGTSSQKMPLPKSSGDPFAGMHLDMRNDAGSLSQADPFRVKASALPNKAPANFAASSNTDLESDGLQDSSAARKSVSSNDANADIASDASAAEDKADANLLEKEFQDADRTPAYNVDDKHAEPVPHEEQFRHFTKDEMKHAKQDVVDRRRNR